VSELVSVIPKTSEAGPLSNERSTSFGSFETSTTFWKYRFEIHQMIVKDGQDPVDSVYQLNLQLFSLTGQETAAIETHGPLPSQIS